MIGSVPGVSRSRGHLNPSPITPVHRLPPPADLAEAVAHFWIPEWDLPPGEVWRQWVLTYPVVNLVIQPAAPEGEVTAHGPHTSISYRDLTGRGWAVGTLLKPAAVPAVIAAAGQRAVAARQLVDQHVSLEQPELLAGVV